MLDVKGFAIGIIMLAVAFGIGRWTAPEPITSVPTPIVTQDTTITEFTFWRDIAKPDTVRDTLEVPVPTPVGEHNYYDVNYSDSLLASNIGLTVDGTLQEVTYEYYMKRQYTAERSTEIRVNRTWSTVEEQRPPRFQHSIQAGLKYTNDFNQGFYAEYRPELRFLGVNLVGTAHISNNSYLTVGVKFDL